MDYENRREALNVDNNHDLLGEILNAYSASEAIEKIKVWEEKQKADDEIKVGDEVIWNDYSKGIVIEIIDCNLRGFTSRLCPFEWRKEFCRRTGRHFDQIAEVLEKLKEAQDEDNASTR